jgi:hypothetical protein
MMNLYRQSLMKKPVVYALAVLCVSMFIVSYFVGRMSSVLSDLETMNRFQEVLHKRTGARWRFGWDSDMLQVFVGSQVVNLYECDTRVTTITMGDSVPNGGGLSIQLDKNSHPTNLAFPVSPYSFVVLDKTVDQWFLVDSLFQPHEMVFPHVVNFNHFKFNTKTY